MLFWISPLLYYPWVWESQLLRGNLNCDPFTTLYISVPLSLQFLNYKYLLFFINVLYHIQMNMFTSKLKSAPSLLPTPLPWVTESVNSGTNSNHLHHGNVQWLKSQFNRWITISSSLFCQKILVLTNMNVTRQVPASNIENKNTTRRGLVVGFSTMYNRFPTALELSKVFLSTKYSITFTYGSYLEKDSETIVSSSKALSHLCFMPHVLGKLGCSKLTLHNWRSCCRYLCLVAAPDVRTYPTLNVDGFCSNLWG